jgi:ribosomal-protein-alanine N-acetyltransferase
VSSEALSLYPVIRTLSADDLERIMEIEQAAYAFPWSMGIFADCLRVGYECHGLQVDGLLVGYVIQTHFAGEAHILNLCVDPAWQRRRLGGLLLEQAIRLARTAECTNVFLEVRPSNRAGLGLYRKRGFYIVGERPDYYRAGNGREAALVMRLDLGASNEETLKILPRHDPF